MKKIIILATYISLGMVSFAQTEGISGGPVNTPTEGVVDGVYIQQHIPTKRMIPYEYVREADVIWSRRVWSYIDMREKINLPMYYPLDFYVDGEWVKNGSRWSLWTVIKQHILSGDLTVFEPKNPLDVFGNGVWDGDQFKYPLRPAVGLNYDTDSTYRRYIDSYLNMVTNARFENLKNSVGEDSVTIDPVTLAEIYIPIEVADTVKILSEHILQYRLKEDWFFDKERSVLDVRILGIAPVIFEGMKEGGKYKELFWLYFPHCRFVFNNYFVYNDQNDAQWMSFDDLFWKRRFKSVIYKESNTYDRKVESYRAGVDALHEAEKIKEEIRTFEHDVWNF